MKIYKKLFKYMRPYLSNLIGGLICLILVGIIGLLVPWLFKFLIDDVLIKGNEIILNYIAGGAILLYFLKGIFNYSQKYLISGLSQQVIVDLRNELYQHLQKLSLSFFERQRTGDLMSRITNDVNVIQTSLTTGLSNLVLQPIMVVGIVGFLLYIDWKLALVSFLIIPLISFAISRFGFKMRSISTKIQNEMSNVTNILQETLSAVRIVKAFNNEDKEIKRFLKANDRTLKENLKGVQVEATITPIVELIIALGSAAFLWYGGHKVLNGQMTTGELITFIGYIGLLISPINILSQSYNLMQKAIGASERIFNLLEVDERVKESEDAFEMPKIEGNVQFKNVTFSYNKNEKVLKNINLSVSFGEMVAFVGPSGAGKTTMVNLIPRFYDVDTGKVLIDGINVKDVKLNSLRKQIGIVPQETVLFKGTVAENIAYGADHKSKEEIVKAAQKANADQFIRGFEKSYETEVGERGVSLSGGQKQRISIARALLTDHKILILDEATSSLDLKSESLIQEALERLIKDKTTFVIAHRLSTVINADKIVVLEDGEIVEIGKHKELIKNEGHYFDLYKSQFEQG
ncbi:MAG: ABC transporter ATP-binding protein/permease [Halanaerobiales bacterium]|nr:ABC transporter ATP-binding protein/permease [Halanaerobiales bacterium]